MLDAGKNICSTSLQMRIRSTTKFSYGSIIKPENIISPRWDNFFIKGNPNLLLEKYFFGRIISIECRAFPSKESFTEGTKFLFTDFMDQSHLSVRIGEKNHGYYIPDAGSAFNIEPIDKEEFLINRMQSFNVVATLPKELEVNWRIALKMELFRPIQ